VSRATGDDATGLLQRRLDTDLRTRRRSWLVKGVAALGLERWARVVAVALVPLLISGRSDEVLLGVGLLFPALGLYVMLTALLPRHRLLQGADLVVSALLVLLTGSDVVDNFLTGSDAAPYLPFILVAVAGPAAREGLWAGMAAGGVLGSLLLVAFVFDSEPPAIGIAAAVATILLPPLAGVTAAAAGEVMEGRALRDRRILQEANRLLSSLQAIADEVPGGLDVSTVASSFMTEVRQLPGVQAAALLADDGAGYHQIGRTGRMLDVHSHVRRDELGEVLGRRAVVVSADTLPSALSESCADVRSWLVLPVGDDQPPSAVLLVGFDEPDVANATRPVLQPLADDASLALENAHLFEGTRSRAVDAARRQLAADLHDGVAQSLAHLRMELELLALRDSDARPETQRLAKVAESAMLDLRRTISGLRLSHEDALGARLERHLREVRAPHGPRLELVVLDDPPLDAVTIEEVFRVAQEAVSNALRHAEAREVTVHLDRVGGDLLLRVEDDGIGVDDVAMGSATGVGLASMRERASRLQAQLLVEPGERGGTCVVLRVPARPTVHEPSTPTGS
jgi:signal transduction histidine kinase